MTRRVRRLLGQVGAMASEETCGEIVTIESYVFRKILSRIRMAAGGAIIGVGFSAGDNRQGSV